MFRGLLRKILIGWLLLLCVAATQAAAPAAGTVISNTAFATFVDTVTLASVRLSSNTVNTRVTALEALTLTADQSLSLGPGTPFVASHLLTNTGNVSTFYQLTVTPQAGPWTPLNLVVVHDTNRNGRVDSGEVAVPAAGLELAAGDSAQLLVTGVVPS